MPRGSPIGLGRVRNRWQGHILVRRHVFIRRTEWQVRFDQADRQKERLVFSGQLRKLLRSFVRDQAIAVDRVAAGSTLQSIHLVLGVRNSAANFTIGQTVHGASRMFPCSAGHQLPIPRVWHFEVGLVVPVLTAPAARMMRHLTNRHGRVSIPPKPVRHAWMHRVRLVFDLLRSFKYRIVAGRTV